MKIDKCCYRVVIMGLGEHGGLIATAKSEFEFSWNGDTTEIGAAKQVFAEAAREFNNWRFVSTISKNIKVQFDALVFFGGDVEICEIACTSGGGKYKRCQSYPFPEDQLPPALRAFFVKCKERIS